MIVTEEHRQAAKLTPEKKAMPAHVKAALGRGKCKDCDLPWDSVAPGFHIPLPDSQEWLCGFCYIQPIVRIKYGLEAAPIRSTNRRSLAYRQKQMARRKNSL